MFLPNDLFEVYIWNINKQSIHTFIQFLVNLKERKGWYFNKHFMHSQVKVRNTINIRISFLEQLHHYVETMKCIQVHSKTARDKSLKTYTDLLLLIQSLIFFKINSQVFGWLIIKTEINSSFSRLFETVFTFAYNLPWLSIFTCKKRWW